MPGQLEDPHDPGNPEHLDDPSDVIKRGRSAIVFLPASTCAIAAAVVMAEHVILGMVWKQVVEVYRHSCERRGILFSVLFLWYLAQALAALHLKIPFCMSTRWV